MNKDMNMGSSIMNPLAECLVSVTNETVTENNADTYKSSLNALVDFFGMVGGMRNNQKRVWELFLKAYAEDKLLAMKALFYLRDIRGGQGERELFRYILKNLVLLDEKIVSQNIYNVAEFGRWDDLFVLLDKEVPNDMQNNVFGVICTQLFRDLAKVEEDRQDISLLAKWMPSINTSSKNSRSLARRFAMWLGWSEKQYRKNLSKLRGVLRVVEKKMSARQWSDINYSAVPSKASLLYRKAFARHDEERYAQYLQDVLSGKQKMNAGTLHPSDIVGKFLKADSDPTTALDNTLEAAWKSLPNFFGENKTRNILTVADVSGSMSCYDNGKPLHVSIALALYTAEKNEGAFHGSFLTFAGRPEFVRVTGHTLREKVTNISRANWGQDTNIEAIFDLLLKVAIDNQIKQKDMPEQMLIISDMEFNEASDMLLKELSPLFDVIQKKYESSGYKAPHLVFWNVRSSGYNMPVLYDTKGALTISGYSPSIFSSLLSGDGITPRSQCLHTLNQERYNVITAD